MNEHLFEHKIFFVFRNAHLVASPFFYLSKLLLLFRHETVIVLKAEYLSSQVKHQKDYEGKTVKSTSNKMKVDINTSVSCTSSNVMYLIVDRNAPNNT